MALPTYRDIDFHDIPKALKAAGSNRRYVDQGDYSKVMRELEQTLALNPLHIRVDDHDISESIIRGQIASAGDVTPPAPTVLAPLDNAVGVAVSVKPTVTFGEAIVFGGSGSFSLFLVTGNVLVKQWSVANDQGTGPGQCAISGNGVVLTPPANLTAATAYYVTWTAGAVRDLAGNNCAAQASATVWNWTTA